MSRNAEVAARLEEYADLLAAQGDDYRPRSYRTAAENVRDHPRPIEDVVADGDVQDIDGVGESIGDKIAEYVETGEIEALEDAREELPVDVAGLTAVEGVGPKTVGKLYEALGITDLDDLERAAENGEIRGVEGFGETSERNIREGIEFARRSRERTLLGESRPLAEDALAHLRTVDAVETCEVAGSLRRWRETSGDVDVLAAAADRTAVVAAFTDWERAAEVIEAGETKAAVRVAGERVDLRVVAPSEWGAALQYFTGSREHNVRLRNHAIDRDLKVNEYGVFDVAEVPDPDAGQRVGERVAGETEAGVYEALDCDWIPPELREDRGEVAAAETGSLPDLVAESDVRGDLHVHSDWSDGDASIAEMVDGAAAFGHDYVCITDHAAGPGMVGGVGLGDDALREQLDAVREAAAGADVTVFAGVEANVAADGSISVADDVLAALDLVVASPHSGLEGDGTDRLVAAARHPEVDVIGHPTGRLLTRRPGLDVDTRRLAAVAAEEGVALEVNANPHRLDLGGDGVREAVEAGAPVAVNTDAHSPGEYRTVTYGVHTARRGWAETSDVLNARDADGLRAFLDG
ncbi:MAG: DNA polymerase/3'-5' exonuclease PolX [Halobacteriaceae archaeon]